MKRGSLKVKLLFIVVFFTITFSMLCLVGNYNLINNSDKENLKNIHLKSNTWTPIEIISTESTGDSGNPAMAVDSLGNVHVAWSDGTDYNGSGTDWDIFYKYWDNLSKTWTMTEVVSTESTATSCYPFIALDKDRNVHVVWQDYTDYNGAGSDADIFYKRRNVTTDVWEDLEVISNSPYPSTTPVLAVDGIGQCHVVWNDGNPLDNKQVCYTRWNATTGVWNNIQCISPLSWANYYPSITVDFEGNAHVIWQRLSLDEPQNLIYRCWNVTMGTWSGYEEIVSGNHPKDTTIVADNSGNIHVAWKSFETHETLEGEYHSIKYNCRSSLNNTWMSTELISTESTDNVSNIAFPTIAVDWEGHVHVAWEDWTDYNGSGIDADIFYKRRNATTGTWTITEVITLESTFNSTVPTIAVDDSGYIHIAWCDFNGSGNDKDIFYKKYSIPQRPNPTSPVLYSITPNPNNDGIINLNWSCEGDAITYYIFRDTSYITSVDGMTPIATIETNHYQDIIPFNGTYYYVVLAGHGIGNSSISNCENVTIEVLLPASPILNPILPSPNTEGNITLIWSVIENATIYYIFRDVSYITSIGGMAPIATVAINTYQDIVIINGTYYYVVIAGSYIGNSSISNCENVTIEVLLPVAPILDPILPNPDFDGVIELSWSEVGVATSYFVYRDIVPISSVDGMTPIAIESLNNYNDGVGAGTYYYVIVANNLGGDSPISNCENVTVIIPPQNPPVLATIQPNPNLDGVIVLSWSPVVEASTYLVYRDISPISFIDGMTPIAELVAKFPFNDYTDGILGNGTYHYVIIACNLAGNSSISNCESVTIIRMPLDPPVLAPIQNPDFDGIIELSWSVVVGATSYFVFRDVSPITSVSGMPYLARVTSTTYTDLVCNLNTYYYVIVANNLVGNSYFSNCRGTTVTNQLETLWYRTINSPPAYPESVAISADGKYIGAGGYNSDNKVYFFENSSSIPLWSYTTGARIESISISANGSYMAVGGSDHNLYLFHQSSSTPLWSYTTRASVWATAISADGNYIVAGGEGVNWRVYLFHRSSSTPLLNYIPSSGVIGTVAISADGNYFVAGTDGLGSNDGKVILFNKTSLTPIWSYTVPGSVMTVAISSDGDYITATGNNRVYLFHRSNSTPLWSYSVSSYSRRNALDISSNGSYIGLGCFNGKVYLFHKSSSTPIKEYYVLGGSSINSISISSNGNYLVSGDNCGFINLFEQTRSTPYASYKINYPVQSVSISADGSRIAAGCSDNNVYLFNMPSPNAVPSTPLLNPVASNPDYDGIIELNWNLVMGATSYFVFRDISPITSVVDRTPIAWVTSTSYTDVILEDGIYYYVIVASNIRGNSSISECRNVTVTISSEDSIITEMTPQLIAIMGILIGVISVGVTYRVTKKRTMKNSIKNYINFSKREAIPIAVLAIMTNMDQQEAQNILTKLIQKNQAIGIIREGTFYRQKKTVASPFLGKEKKEARDLETVVNEKIHFVNLSLESLKIIYERGEINHEVFQLVGAELLSERRELKEQLKSLSKLYTIITPEISAELKDLPISDEEKTIILKEIALFSFEDAKKMLDEFKEIINSTKNIKA